MRPRCARSKLAFTPGRRRPTTRGLRRRLFGLTFPNPIGIAAGYDKDARVYNALFDIGFGFAEVGTITPKPQPGNPRPRVFRLMRERGIVNRLGFNSAGHADALVRLAAKPPRGVLGVNIGPNKDSAGAIADFVAGVRAFGPSASYLTVNISSPNTPDLRDLQAPERLDALLEAVMAARGRLARPVPILVKIAPDLHDDDIAPVMRCLTSHGVDGAILTNTTLSREGIPTDSHRNEPGGMSGRPLFTRSTRFLARCYLATEGKLPIIGVGGIDSGVAAVAKIRAGASLIQLYTGLVYEGPALLTEIKEALLAEVKATGKPLASSGGNRGATMGAWLSLQSARFPFDHIRGDLRAVLFDTDLSYSRWPGRPVPARDSASRA